MGRWVTNVWEHEDRPIVAEQQVGAGHASLMAPHEYESDIGGFWRNLESQEANMANLATYEDWFPDLAT